MIGNDFYSFFSLYLYTLFHRIAANFFIQTYLAFAVMARGIVLFPQERAVIKKERNSGAYRLSAYFLSKICAESPVDMVLPFMSCTVFYWMVGFSFDFPTYLWYIATTCLGIAAANSFGVLLGCSIQNFSNAVAMLTVLGLLMTSLSGFLVKDRAIPVWIEWLKYLSLMRHSFLGSLLAILSITAFDCAEYSEFAVCQTNHVQYDGYIHMDAILESYEIEQKYWLCIVLLMTLVTFWYGIAYIFIRRTTQANNL